MLMLDLQVSEPSGRPVYMIGLTIQLMIEPARRGYDDLTRERLAGLFGAPERWAVTTHSLVWAQLDVARPGVHGFDHGDGADGVQLRPRGSRRQVPDALPDGEVPMALHFSGIVYYPNERGGLQMVLVPWSCSIDYRMPVAMWRETIDHYYPNTGWVTLRSATLAALEHERVQRGLPTYDACISELLEGEGDG